MSYKGIRFWKCIIARNRSEKEQQNITMQFYYWKKGITLTRSDSCDSFAKKKTYFVGHLEIYHVFSRQTCNFPSMPRVLAWLWHSPESSKRVSVSWADGHTGTTGVLGPRFWGTRWLAKPRRRVLKSPVPERPVVPVCKISGCKINRLALELFYILKKDAAILLWAVEEED